MTGGETGPDDPERCATGILGGGFEGGSGEEGRLLGRAAGVDPEAAEEGGEARVARNVAEGLQHGARGRLAERAEEDGPQQLLEPEGEQLAQHKVRDRIDGELGLLDVTVDVLLVVRKALVELGQVLLPELDVERALVADEYPVVGATALSIVFTHQVELQRRFTTTGT